jgi:hypothetical protein
MINSLATSFEQLLQLAETLPLPKSETEREVCWCENSNTVGFSRQVNGSIELFLCGDELRTASPLVRRHLRYDQWSRTTGGLFRANRLVFPADEHYTAATAFLAEELLRRDAVISLQNGFSLTEPLIEMMLRRTALSEEEVLGLIGELRFLEVLLSIAPDETKKALTLDSWRGHEQTSRDFVFSNAFVEVKATRGDRSLHQISSLMQVDPRRSEGELPVEQLHLLSLGFKPVLTSENKAVSISLPQQVDVILKQLGGITTKGTRNALQNLFLSKVENYGSTLGHGYVHDEMQNWAAYKAGWQHGFLRVYDMSDESVQVLRRSDVRRRGHVVFESVRFTIDLPDQITGELNPKNDLFALAKELLT